MFLIRIHLRERVGTHNLRKLIHAAGIREAVYISARSFHRVLLAVSRNCLGIRHYAA